MHSSMQKVVAQPDPKLRKVSRFFFCPFTEEYLQSGFNTTGEIISLTQAYPPASGPSGNQSRTGSVEDCVLPKSAPLI